MMVKFLISSIQVTNKSQLKIAKVLKKITEDLFYQEVVITFSSGDVILTKSQTAPEGIRRSNSQIEIIAKSEANLLAIGTQAILRLYLEKLEVGETLVSFEQTERILMIDMARKYFSKETLMRFIDSMSLAQFNYLQLHFSENEGFRIESEVAPEIVSEQYLSKNDIREVIQYADLAGIEIIPDFDTPGHLKQILKDKPEWQLQKMSETGQIEKATTALDITNQEAVLFIESLYEEYAELFKGSRYFHIGGDEFVDFDEIDAYPSLKQAAMDLYGPKATATDYFVHYVNRIADKISGLGFIPRVWNDGFFRLNRQEVVSLSKKVEITYWTKWHKNMAPVTTFVEKEYTIINFNNNYFYYVLGENAGYTYPTYDKILSEWTPLMYPQSQKIEEITPQYPGVALAIWCDIPDAQSEAEVWGNMSSLLLAVSQKESKVFMTPEEVTEILSNY